MGKTHVGRTLSIHQEHELLLKLEKAGLTGEFAQRVVENQTLAERVVVAIRQGAHKPSASQQEARELMGENFYGVEELAEHFGIILTDEELAKIKEIPFARKTLRRCKDTHILFLGVNHDRAGKPLTILRLSEMFSDDFKWKDWWKDEEFATKETPQLQWYLMRKSHLEKSGNKSFGPQERLLGQNEYRARAVVYAYRMILERKTKDDTLLQGWVMCADRTASHERVGIGCYMEGIEFFARKDDYAHGYLVLVPAIKPEI